jgi:nucleotide-binding universal stress UspA family protein
MEEPMLQFKNILYPINLDSENVSTVIKALEIAKTLNSHIHIMYVNDPGAGYRYPTDREDAVALKVQETAPKELLDQLKITYAVSKGSLADEIVAYCKKNNIDLIITGHKHRNKLYSKLFDTPDESIIDAIHIPVLVIPKH